MSDLRSDPHGLVPDPPLADKTVQRALTDADVAYQVLKDDVRLLKMTQYRGSIATGQTVAEHVAEANPHTQYLLSANTPTATTLGLGTIAVQNATSVSIGGGTLSGVTIISGILTSTQSIAFTSTAVAQQITFAASTASIGGSTGTNVIVKASSPTITGTLSLGTFDYAVLAQGGQVTTAVSTYGELLLGTATAGAALTSGHGSLHIGAAVSAGVTAILSIHTTDSIQLTASNISINASPVTSGSITVSASNFKVSAAGVVSAVSYQASDAPQTAINLDLMRYNYTRTSTTYATTGTSTHTFNAASKAFFGVICAGGGGGGAGSSSTSVMGKYAGCGGGAGGKAYFWGEVTSSEASIVIGAGGSGGSLVGGTGGTGGNSTFTMGGNTITCTGGGGGESGTTGQPGDGGFGWDTSPQFSTMLVVGITGNSGTAGRMTNWTNTSTYDVTGGLGGSDPLIVTGGSAGGGGGGFGGGAGSGGQGGTDGYCIIHEA